MSDSSAVENRPKSKQVGALRGLVPFLLEDVAGIEALNQADGIHPNEAGARRVADTVWRALEPIVRELEVGPTR